jgi:hypothetical protein
MTKPNLKRELRTRTVWLCEQGRLKEFLVYPQHHLLGVLYDWFENSINIGFCITGRFAYLLRQEALA